MLLELCCSTCSCPARIISPLCSDIAPPPPPSASPSSPTVAYTPTLPAEPALSVSLSQSHA
eukprot:3308219-Rhodomonas_salina.1